MGAAATSRRVFTASAAPLLAAHRVRALTATTPAGSGLLPDVPTPAADHDASLERTFGEAVLAPEGHERRVELGADPVGRPARAFAKVLEKGMARWQHVVLASGIDVE